jgi:8-oxo-dGTP pyrophosphatase MutT (NUDIX family)
VEGFNLKAYSELEAYFEDPQPYLDIELTSAGVITFVEDFRHILLVETIDDSVSRRVELPAGKVNHIVDETIYNTAVREFIEETGLSISEEDLKPFMARYYRDGKGGLQFIASIPELQAQRIDKLGRKYIKPIEGTDKGRTVMLISEPIEVFANESISLLRNSKNLWAVDDEVRLTLLLFAQREMKRRENKNNRSIVSRIINKIIDR